MRRDISGLWEEMVGYRYYGDDGGKDERQEIIIQGELEGW